jgi:hypothetical protein
MKTSINTGNPVPTAHVTVNKNRVKMYDNKNYYLNNGQTFEIELFNPTKSKLKADIYLNQDKVSGGGLILKPGERVYLERFVESNNKFLFETYDVEDTEEVKNAISNNGEVKVYFYPESVTYNHIWNTQTSNRRAFYNDNCFTTSTGGTHYLGDITTTTLGCANIGNISNTGALYNNAEDMVLNTSSMETGRVEKGEESNQEFQMVYGDFDNIAMQSVEYKILPLSQKPITKTDVANIKRYCHECGSKTKVKYKFCPVCGEKL